MTVTESSLSPDRAAALAGPDWLRNRRRAAAELLATAVWPTEAAEEWRYSPIDELDLHSFVPTAVAGSATPIRLATAAGTIDLANGVATSIDVAPEHAARGVRLARLADLDDGESFVGELPGADDPLGLMVAAFAPDPVVLQIPAGLTLADELVVSSSIEVGSSNDTPPSVLTQVIVDAGPDSEVTVVIVDASARADALHVPRVDVRIGPAARVRVAALQDLGSGVTSLGRMQVTIADQATFAGWTAGLGGGFARQRVDCRLEGRGSAADFSAAYFGHDRQVLDYRMFVDHIGADTTSNLLFSGVVDDESTAIYTGMIHIHPDARGSNAYQTNRNVKLSDDAWTESVPNLEIENNDVHCSHASTVGPVDEDQLFYLESRGVPTDVAVKLIVSGFFGEVLGKCPVAMLADRARASIADLLQRVEDT